jgi:RNA polymerase sigma factor (sigma-70 family)
MRDKSLEQSVEEARAGSREALERVLEAIQGRVYGLCVRMLWHPEDARDASQEILIRVMTHLGDFRGGSAFGTWVYRVAANYLLDVRRSRLETREYSFEKCGRELDENLAAANTPADDVILLEEIKIGCTLGMLLCLDRPHRLAYILGDVMELNHAQAAAVLDITPAAYRKRLSRARSELVTFLRAKCGLFDPQNPCRCRRRVRYAVDSQRIDPRRPLFAVDRERANEFASALAEIRRLEHDQRAAALYRSLPQPVAPDDFADWLRQRLTRY